MTKGPYVFVVSFAFGTSSRSTHLKNRPATGQAFSTKDGDLSKGLQCVRRRNDCHLGWYAVSPAALYTHP